MRFPPIAFATLVFMLAVNGLRSTASGQEPTTAPTPVLTPTGVDPNQMVNEALNLIEAGNRQSWEAAGEIIDKLRKIAPQLPKVQLACAKWLAADGKGPPAIRYYDYYIKTDEGKTDYRPYADMGRLYMRSKKPRTARRYLEDAVSFAPQQDAKNRFIRAEIMMDLATVMHQLEDNTEAVRTARDAATQANKDPRIQILYSRLLLKVNPTETKEARSVAARAVTLLLEDLGADPVSIPKLQLLREALSVVENTWATEAGMQLNNPEPAHFLSLATQDVAEVTQRIALVAAKEYEERAVELNPNKAEYKIRLAEIEAMLGATRTATDRLDALLANDPDNAEAQAMKIRISTMTHRKIGVAAGL